MSEATPPPSPTPSPPSPAAAGKARESRARIWRKRLTRLIVLAVILGLVFRALIYVLFPTVLRKVAGIYGLNASYDRMELYLLGGDVGLWGLKLTPSEGGDPFLTVSYCRGSISTLALLRGRLHVSRAEAEGATLAVDRTSGGRLPLLEKLVAATKSASPAATQPASNPTTSALSLDAPLFVETLRLQDAYMHFTDHAVLPNADVTMKLSMLVSNIGASQQKTSFTIALNSPQTLAALYIDGSGTTSDRQLDANLNLSMFGLNLLPARQYLAPFGIVPTLKDISGKASGYFQARVTGGTPADSKTPATQPANLAATLKLSALSLSADNQPAASVGDVTVQASSLSAGAIVLDQVLVDRVRAAASRTEQGRLSFAGVELDPSAASAGAAEPSPQAATPPTAAAQPGGPSSVPTIDLKQLKVTDCEFAFTDGLFAPAVVLQLNVPKVQIDHVSTDPAKANQAASLALSANAPGIATAIEVHGTAAPAAAKKTLNLIVSARGIDGAALDPYLAAFGLKRDLNNGTFDGAFNCRLTSEFTAHDDGSFTTGLQLSDVKFAGAGKPLLVMPVVLLKNAKVDLAASRINVGELTLVGPTLPLSHGKGDVFAALGLRTDPQVARPVFATPPPPTAAVALIEPASQPSPQSVAQSIAQSIAQSAAAATAPATTQPRPVTALRLPSVAIGTLSWTGVAVSLHDTSTDGTVDLAINDLKLLGKDLLFDAAAKNAKPGTIDFSAAVPGVVEDVGIKGTIAPTGDSVAFDVKGTASGISAERLRPFMETFNLEPALHAGQLIFGAAGDVRQAGGAVRANLKFADVKLTDGASNWLALGNCSVVDASFDGHIIAAREIDVDSPVAIARRDEAGGISVAGVRLMPAKAGPVVQKAADAAAASAAAKVVATTTTQPANKQSPTTQPIAALPFVGRLGHFDLHKAKLQWRDDAVAPAADITAAIDLSAQALAVGEDHEPSLFTLSVVSPNLIDSLSVTGTVQATPARQGITFDALGSGFTGAAINPYLPPNMGMILKGASLKASGLAVLQQNAAGGLGATLKITGASLTDKGMTTPLAGAASMVIDIDRFDLAERVIAIKELSLEHARLEAWQWNSGAAVMGLAVSQYPFRTPKPAPDVPEQQAAADVSDVGAIMAQALTKPPLISIRKLVLHADSLAVLSSQLGRKVELTNSSLWCPTSIELLGDRPQKNPPFELRVFATIDPLVGQINADAVLAPFASDPSLHADLGIVGLHGDKLTAVLPQLAGMVNGDDLKNGRVTASADAHFKFTRRGVLGIDFSRDIGMDAELKDLKLTEDGVDQPLAGLAGVRVDGFRYTPDGSAYVKTLDIEKPMASVVRDAQGVHVLGLTLKVELPGATRPGGQAASRPATEIASTEPATTLPATTPAIAIAPPTQPSPPAIALGPTTLPTSEPTADATPGSKRRRDLGPEYRIDKLTVSGIDLLLEDRLGSTHTVLPVNDLDVEVKGLTNRALTEPNLPVRFSLIASAGKVELPVRKQVSGGPSSDTRPVFAEASASGNVTMVPKPVGYLKASISGFELTSVRGLASQYGVTITGGTFDGRVDVRMNGGDTFTAKAFPTLNEARLREGDNGPIRRTFHLPSPVDVAISTVEDADGSITFPLEIPIEAGKLDTGAVLASAVGSVSRVIGDAMLAAPAKAAKLALMAFGVDVSSARTKAVAPVVVDFPGGESQLSDDQLQQVQAVVELLKKDDTLHVTLQHTLGTGDVVLAQTRVNPLKEDTQQLAEQFRQEKYRLQRNLSEQTGAARVAMAAGTDPGSALAQLRATSVRLNDAESALDQILELLRPGADRQTDRRTKQASILLGELRLRAVQAALLASGLQGADQRVSKGPAKYNAEDGAGHVTLVLTRQAKS